MRRNEVCDHVNERERSVHIEYELPRLADMLDWSKMEMNEVWSIYIWVIMNIISFLG